MPEYREVFGGEEVECPECGTVGGFPESYFTEDDDLICTTCEEVVGRVNPRGELAEIRVPDT